MLLFSTDNISYIWRIEGDWLGSYGRCRHVRYRQDLIDRELPCMFNYIMQLMGFCS